MSSFVLKFSLGRFLSGGNNSKLTKSDTKKAVIAAKSLLKSVGGQVEAQVYWLE